MKMNSAMVQMQNDEVRRKCPSCLAGSIKLGEAGAIVVTATFHARPHQWRIAALEAIRDYKDFKPDNDPYKEHDLVLTRVGTEMVRAQFGYYANDQMEEGADDPSDCFRVLTIGLASDF